MNAADKKSIKNRVFDLREKINTQQKQLNNEIDKQMHRFEDVFDISIKDYEAAPGAVLSGLFAIAKMIEINSKVERFNQIEKNRELQRALGLKEDLVAKLTHQVNERLNIIDKAETNNLNNFLKENDVYSIFEKGKFESFLDNKENDKLHKKERKKEYIQEQNYERD